MDNNWKWSQEFSKKIFEDKYMLHGEESIEQVVEEIAEEIAFADINNPNYNQIKDDFYNEIISGNFLPAGRIMANARPDSPMKNYNNCFTIDIEDSMESITNSLKEYMTILKSGGGVGLNISKLRPKGTVISTGGITSGPLSFMRIFNEASKTISVGGGRRGATIVIMNDNHPDIEEFITCKQGDDNKALTQMNISVGITDNFMSAVKNNLDWDLVFDDKVYKTVKAKYIYDMIANNAYCVSGDTEIPILSKYQDSVDFIKIKNLDLNKKYYTYTINPKTLLQEVKPIQNIIYNGNRDTMKISLSNGYQFYATPDHTMLVADKGNPFVEKTVDQLQKGDWICRIGHPKINNSLNVNEDIDFWMMIGFWVGDGSLKETQVRFSINNYTQEYILPILDRVAKRYNKDVKKYIDKRTDKYAEFTINSKELVQDIKDLGLNVKEGKVVPYKLFNLWNENNSISFIKGYLTADGHVHNVHNNIIFNSKSEILINGIIKLLWFLGVSTSKSISSANQFNIPIYSGTINKSCMQNIINKDIYPLYYKGDKNAIDEYFPIQSYNYKKIKNRNKSKIWRNNGRISQSCFKDKKDNDLLYEKIINIEYMNKDDVYDLTISDNHNFIDSNGYVFHNCHNEPGIFNMDISQKYNNAPNDFIIDRTNPCGEICMPSYSLCCLGSINLTKFVKNPFTNNANFDFPSFINTIKTGVRFLDNTLDVTDYPLYRIEEFSKKYRRIGLGFTGLGDTFIMMRMVYGGTKSKKISKLIANCLRENSYIASLDLAKEKGSYPACKKDELSNANFIKDHFDSKYIDQVKKYGLRNVGLNTIAPTGTISLSMGQNCSSGIEPAFALEYNRITRLGKGDETITTKIYDYAWLEYKKWVDSKCPEGSDNVGNYYDLESGLLGVPDYFTTAAEVDPMDAIDIQAIFQNEIDHSISKTHNLKSETTFDDYQKLFMYAYDKGLKGFTTFNPSGSMKGVLELDEKETSNRPSFIKRQDAPHRPAELDCDIHEITVNKERHIILVGKLEGTLYEIFVTNDIENTIDPIKYKHGTIKKIKKGHYSLVVKNGQEKIVIDNIAEKFDAEYASLSRFISMSLRHGVSLQFIVTQLHKDQNFVGFEKSVGRVIKKYIKEGEKVETSEVCPSCGSNKLIYQEGCRSCLDCGTSLCG